MTKQQLFVLALQNLKPGAQWALSGVNYSELDWHDETQTKPTEEEVVQKIAELTYQQEVEVYKEQRAAEYPSYADQFDQIFHDGVDAWKATILEVREDIQSRLWNPKFLRKERDRHWQI